MKKLILSFFIFFATGSVLMAEAVTFEATINSPRISLDEVLQLTLTFTGINNDLDPISLPVLDGFTAKYLGPSTSVSIVNGDYHSERSFMYNLFPNKVGHFQIPPISATISGQTYTTKPMDVEVYQSTNQPQAASQSPDQNQAPTLDSLKDKLKIMLSIGKTSVFLNEQIPVSIKLLVNGVPVRDIQFPQFDKSSIRVDDFDKPQQDSQLIDGVKYDTVEFKTNIYPNQLGDITFGPVQIQGNIIYKNNQNNPFNQDNDILGVNSVFNNFFDSYATRPIVLTSQAVTLHVARLPDTHRPSDFTGAIGQFDFQAGISPLALKAGDPITLKMTVQGAGNFTNLKMPEVKPEGFKFYTPQIKDLGGQKTLEEVIIPTSAAIKEVPAIKFSYFDTSIRDYKTIIQGPFPIQVSAPSPDQEFKAVGFADISKESTALSVSSFSWVKLIRNIYDQAKKLFGLIWIKICLGIIFLGLMVYFTWKSIQDRLDKDPALARRLKAFRDANNTLKQAEALIITGETKKFYGLLSKILCDYLANKWHQNSAALTKDVILEKLKIAKIDEGIVLQVKGLMEQSDFVCFAGANRDANQMRADLSQSQEIILKLEKGLR